MPTFCFIKITSGNSYENEAPHILEGVVQALRLQELDSEFLKFPLLDGHILHVLNIALTRCGKENTEVPNAMEGARAYKLPRYLFTVN